jgi:hypothetical protein
MALGITTATRTFSAVGAAVAVAGAPAPQALKMSESARTNVNNHANFFIFFSLVGTIFLSNNGCFFDIQLQEICGIAPPIEINFPFQRVWSMRMEHVLSILWQLTPKW